MIMKGRILDGSRLYLDSRDMTSSALPDIARRATQQAQQNLGIDAMRVG